MAIPVNKTDVIVESGAVEPGALAPAATLFHGLSDPTRLAILQHLTVGEHRVRDLTEHLGLAQSTVSAHLACLRDCGLVDSRPQGRASMFSLTTAPELLEVLATAEKLLAATGYAVALCPNYGIGTTDNPDPADLKTHHSAESDQ
ncbi:helix-turn-helix transcriptional regulator [Georgenia sp. SYP-B2076]|uniref:ArsR/SmtB family transcription factor n=1 Tax=Georgenia sp. SYP-B2076 TaxID=2495881 RepID=UPI000F8D5632|nr:metalloregulator ArsR/SmtB family transcription factor [Georgenia sp. SYP-B2076]